MDAHTHIHKHADAAASSVDRTLRSILVYNFVFAFAFLLPFGITTGVVVLPLGIVPAFVSAILGLIGLGRGLRHKGVAIPLDGVAAAFLLGLLIPSWHTLVNYNRWRSFDSGKIMIGTYGTVPLMIDFCIHIFCIIRHLPLPGLALTATCPNCQHDVQPEFRFPPPRTLWNSSTIFTPETEESHRERITRDFIDDIDEDTATTLRAPSEGDSTIYPDHPRRSTDALLAKNGGQHA